MERYKNSLAVVHIKGRRYKDSFKEEVVKSIFSGRFSSIEAARRFYGISGGETVKKWLEEYICIEDLTKDIVRMQKKEKSPNLEEELEKQAKQIRELEELLRREKLKNELNKAFIEIAEEDYGINLRKKYGAKQLEKSKRSAGKRSR